MSSLGEDYISTLPLASNEFFKHTNTHTRELFNNTHRLSIQNNNTVTKSDETKQQIKPKQFQPLQNAFTELILNHLYVLIRNVSLSLLFSLALPTFPQGVKCALSHVCACPCAIMFGRAINSVSLGNA